MSNGGANRWKTRKKSEDGIDEESPAGVAQEGMVKSFDQNSGYGFIECPAIFARHRRDVFVHHKQINGFRVGDRVAFVVKMNAKGAPQAYDLAPAAGESPRDSAPVEPSPVSAPIAQEEDQSIFCGTLKSFNKLNGYGFIECADTFSKFGRDVFAHQSQIDGISVGNQVYFRIQVKRDQPQAHDVMRELPTAESEPSASAWLDAAAKSLLQESEASCETSNAENDATLAKEMDAPAKEPKVDICDKVSRQLLRACVSTSESSLNTMKELLGKRADPNARDITGQLPIMCVALSSKHVERKIRLLIESKANVHEIHRDSSLTVLEWVRMRIGKSMAGYCKALSEGREPTGHEILMTGCQFDEY